MGRSRSHRPPRRYPRPRRSSPSINLWATVPAVMKRGSFQDIMTRPRPSARSAAVRACAQPCRPRASGTPLACLSMLGSAAFTAACCRTKARAPLPRESRWTSGAFSQAKAVATRSHVCGKSPASNATPSCPVRPACTRSCQVFRTPYPLATSPCRVPHLVLAR